MVGGDDQPALDPGVLAAGARVAEVDEEERRQEDPRQQVERPVDAVLAACRRGSGESLGGHAERYTTGASVVTRARGYQAPSTSAASSSRLGRLAGRRPARGAEHRLDRLLQAVAIGAEGAEAGRVAAELEEARLERVGSVPSAAASAA